MADCKQKEKRKRKRKRKKDTEGLAQQSKQRKAVMLKRTNQHLVRLNASMVRIIPSSLARVLLYYVM